VPELSAIPLLGTACSITTGNRDSELTTLARSRPTRIAGRHGRLSRESVSIRLNATSRRAVRLVLVVGATVPHEVAGFAGGAKYFLPRRRGPELTHLTHWLGALATIERVIGRVETPTRTSSRRRRRS
jgi:nickel-dependent lactate racemase